jgi:glyoxylase-like metal-dependent hydrolase (beta-lactamase superfamily II)
MSLQTSEDLPICSACGTQFSTAPKSCRICDDPRQYVPPTGQTWTSLSQLRHSPHQYRNTFTPSTSPDALPYTTIETTPKFGIGQRAFLLPTASGANILWDCIAYLDRETVDFIRSRGGLEAIVISHPHYYTTHLDWARTFDCPVWIAAEDAGWVCRGEDDYGEGRRRRRLMREGRMSLGGGGPGGVEIVKVGGHFPGSLVAVWRTALLIADSLVTTPVRFVRGLDC